MKIITTTGLKKVWHSIFGDAATVDGYNAADLGQLCAFVHDATDRTNNTTSYIAHAGSTLSLTFPSTGYLWVFYTWTWGVNATRTLGAYAKVYLDDVAEDVFVSWAGSSGYYLGCCIAQRSASSYAAGSHTAKLYFRAATAGDTVTIYDLTGSAFFVKT